MIRFPRWKSGTWVVVVMLGGATLLGLFANAFRKHVRPLIRPATTSTAPSTLPAGAR